MRRRIVSMSANKQTTWVSSVGLVVLLAVVYAITGRVGQFTAIPPGHITLIWPPSGIALAAALLLGRRVWPGVWLGSFLVNNWVSIHGAEPVTLAEASAASAIIGVGAASGAVAG